MCIISLQNSYFLQIRQLGLKGYDVFINLCDGPWDDETAGIEALSALEQFGLPFTGARSEFFLTTKEQMKMNALFWGVTTPAFVSDKLTTCNNTKGICL